MAPGQPGTSFRAERRLLQAVVALLCLVPLSAGLAGVLVGPAMVGEGPGTPPDLDSHYRYLSGIFLGVGLLFACTVPPSNGAGRRSVWARRWWCWAGWGGCCPCCSTVRRPCRTWSGWAWSWVWCRCSAYGRGGWRD